MPRYDKPEPKKKSKYRIPYKKRKKVYTKTYKSTDEVDEDEKTEKDIFLEIWEEREHVSELTGAALTSEPLAQYFAHILPKGTYPELRLKKDNIILVTLDEHYQIDHQTHKAKEHPQLKRFFELQQQLKERYGII